jgi:hypothetical protein
MAGVAQFHDYFTPSESGGIRGASHQICRSSFGELMNIDLKPKPLSKFGQIGRSILKRFMYSQLAILSGIKIAVGRENPLVRFTVEKDPPSIYWVYRIKSSAIKDLERNIEIPENFSLCPIRCLETDEPAYLLTVNAYRVSGLANGLRAEWSVFVRDAENTPRYLIVDARSSQRSVDPVDIITRASTVIHEKSGEKIHTQIGEEDRAFRSTISHADIGTPVKTSLDWVSANDFIYWGNGVCDRTFYDAGLANAEQHRIGNEHCVISDGSVWSQFVEPEPAHVLILQKSIEFVISPWENIDRLHSR